MKVLRFTLKLALVVAVFIAGYGYGRWYALPDTAQASATNKRRILYYVDPMNPAHKSDKPGAAPDGMALQPVYADEASVAPAATPEAATAVPNFPMGTIQISPQRQQRIGVKYGMPSLGAAVKSIRAVGKVAPDEQRIARIHTRVDGWIDKVFVDFTGREVEKNQPLLTLYSPDLLATQEEYLLALKGQDLMKASTLEGALGQSESLVAASRRRLLLWDLTADQIDEIARTGKPVTNITIYSPVSGYVTARNAFPKQRIMPDTELYTIIDLSRVWIMADVFESEASLVQINQPVTIDLSYGPPGGLKGRVDYIQPQIDPVTRTLKIRIEAENPRMALKPDMFVNVNFRIALPQHITVPRDAVLDAGLKKIIFVDRGNGYLEPREVETGEQLGDNIEILRGLRPDERIVISGTFLIDSESQLKSAASGMGGMPGMPGMGGSNSSQQAAPPKPSAEPGKQMQNTKDTKGMKDMKDMQDMPGMPGMGKRP